VEAGAVVEVSYSWVAAQAMVPKKGMSPVRAAGMVSRYLPGTGSIKYLCNGGLLGLAPLCYYAILRKGQVSVRTLFGSGSVTTRVEESVFIIFRAGILMSGIS